MATEAEKLAALRAKIDAVDESIHSLLMQRTSVIDELIAVKGAAKTKGAAFRPGREASMMEILAERHQGSIPFATIAHIWREVISTFTYMQAGYEVHMAIEGADPHTLHDIARYQFGFTVPLHVHEQASDALDAAAAANAIAVVNAETGTHWWQRLGHDQGLMVMAKLPIHDMPFGTGTVFCVAPPLSDPSPFDVRLYAGSVSKPDALEEWPADSVECVIMGGETNIQVMFGLREGQKAPDGVLDIRAVGGYFAPDLKLSTENG